MWERIIEIFRKEIRTVLREPRMRVMLFVPPLMQLIIFGFAVNLDVDTVNDGMDGYGRHAASRELLARFQGSGRFQIVATPKSGEELQGLLDHGAVQAGIRVLPGFGRDLKRGRSRRRASPDRRHELEYRIVSRQLCEPDHQRLLRRMDWGSDEHAAIGALNERAK